jgi:hypothetical protein
VTQRVGLHTAVSVLIEPERRLRAEHRIGRSTRQKEGAWPSRDRTHRACPVAGAGAPPGCRRDDRGSGRPEAEWGHGQGHGRDPRPSTTVRDWLSRFHERAPALGRGLVAWAIGQGADVGPPHVARTRGLSPRSALLATPGAGEGQGVWGRSFDLSSMAAGSRLRLGSLPGDPGLPGSVRKCRVDACAPSAGGGRSMPARPPGPASGKAPQSSSLATWVGSKIHVPAAPMSQAPLNHMQRAAADPCSSCRINSTSRRREWGRSARATPPGPGPEGLGPPRQAGRRTARRHA